MESSHATLNASQISASYDGTHLFTLDSWALKQGDSSIILGPSGCGKSTLLAMLTGLQKPDSGHITYGDTDIYELDESARDQFRGKEIGILFQGFHLVKSFTVRQNLLLALSLSGRAVDEARIESLLAQLNLKDKASQAAGTLSIGEAQRLAVARAVIGKPAWVFCDEPSSALDDANAEQMLHLLKEQAQECRASLVIVTHDKRVKDFFPDTDILELGGNG
ncbi:MAG: ATP-binding cassette domain-containing protein [Rickettsiales bacterium]|nr:ATP-binding cassette domain-containing protein [Rickettsiales bacterium]